MRCSFSVVFQSQESDILVLRDSGQGTSITNDAENLVSYLSRTHVLKPNTQLLYYDTSNQLDQIVHSDGRFVGFAPGPSVNRETRPL